MAKKVNSPRKISLKTSATVVRSSKPRSDKYNHNDKDSTWKSGKSGGTGLDDYNLDIMKLG